MRWIAVRHNKEARRDSEADALTISGSAVRSVGLRPCAGRSLTDAYLQRVVQVEPLQRGKPLQRTVHRVLGRLVGLQPSVPRVLRAVVL